MSGTSLFSRKLMRRLAGVAMYLLLLGAAPPEAKKEQRDIPSKGSTKFLSAFREAVARVNHSTVRIQCEGKNAVLGTVVGPDGWILTKASELKGVPVCKLDDNKALEAQVVGVHEAFDLALLKVDAHGLTPVAWTDSKAAQVGNWLVSAGPGPEPVAAGVVSVATRTLSPGEAGPTKPPPGGYLGIRMAPGESGPKVEEVLRDSAARKAGIKVDDEILSVDDKPTDQPQTLQQVLRKAKPGEVVLLKVKRGDKELELKAKLARRPITMGDATSTMGGKLSERRSGFTSLLQHDTVLRPEDCGGPVVDLDGKVLGINIARAARVETFALPSEAVRSVLADLMSGKLAPKEPQEEDPG